MKKAEKLGVKVTSLGQLDSWLKNFHGEHAQNKPRQVSTQDAQTGVRGLKAPFIKVEDRSQ